MDWILIIPPLGFLLDLNPTWFVPIKVFLFIIIYFLFVVMILILHGRRCRVLMVSVLESGWRGLGQEVWVHNMAESLCYVTLCYVTLCYVTSLQPGV